MKQEKNGKRTTVKTRNEQFSEREHGAYNTIFPTKTRVVTLIQQQFTNQHCKTYSMAGFVCFAV